jgi:hypothetical protein
MLFKVTIITVKIFLYMVIFVELLFGVNVSPNRFIFLGLALFSEMEPSPIPVKIIIRVLVRGEYAGSVVTQALPFVVFLKKPELSRLLITPFKPVMVGYIVS